MQPNAAASVKVKKLRFGFFQGWERFKAN